MNREEIAQREVGHTEITAPLAWILVVVFLATLAVVPGIQAVHWAASGFSTEAGAQFPMIRSLVLPALAIGGAADAQGSPLTKLNAANRAMLREIESIEDDLVEVSEAGKLLRPRVQEALLRVGWGTEQVRIGRGGWLFFEPALHYLTGRGFLEPEYQEQRVRSTASWLDPPTCDPVPAIVDFADQLERRGIELVLLPVPVKAGAVPDRLSGRLRSGAVLHNSSWTTFLDRLRTAGVRVELADDALEAVETPFLKTDTHWTWPAMDAVAQRLAELLRTSGVTPVCDFDTQSTAASNRGDLAEMLPLVNPSRFPEESIDIQSVDSSRCTAEASVLVLGDSFSNIYSDPALGWGSRAGLSERLAWHLRAPVTSIVRNNDGAFATRLQLARKLAENPELLSTVRTVIWEFTERELSLGDWRMLSLGGSAEGGSSFVRLEAGETRLLKGTITAMGEVPVPDEAAYPDYLIGLHLTGIQSADESGRTEALVFVWAMRDYTLTAGAHLRVGDEVRLSVRPWSDVSGELDTITRGEIFDERLLTQSPCWGEVVSE